MDKYNLIIVLGITLISLSCSKPEIDTTDLQSKKYRKIMTGKIVPLEQIKPYLEKIHVGDDLYDILSMLGRPTRLEIRMPKERYESNGSVATYLIYRKKKGIVNEKTDRHLQLFFDVNDKLISFAKKNID